MVNNHLERLFRATVGSKKPSFYGYYENDVYYCTVTLKMRVSKQSMKRKKHQNELVGLDKQRKIAKKTWGGFS